MSHEFLDGLVALAAVLLFFGALAAVGGALEAIASALDWLAARRARNRRRPMAVPRPNVRSQRRPRSWQVPL